MKARLAAAVLACFVAAGLKSGSYSQLPTFRAGVDVVYVDVSVLDGNRKPVRGLTADDFTVKEDGKVRPIVAFSAVSVPAKPDQPPAPWADEAAPDVVSNAQTREGRLVMILMDQTIPQGTAITRARQVATAALDQLRPGDLASVTYASAFARNGTSQDFTADRARLRQSIESPFFGLVIAPFMPPAGGPGGVSGLQEGDPHDNDNICYCGACMLDTVARVATSVRDVPLRRKSLLLIASGSGVYMEGPDLNAPNLLAVSGKSAECSNRINKARDGMFTALREANVTIQAFDPTGLETFTPGLGVGRGGAGRSVQQAGQQTRERQNVLQTLAEQTGGRSFTNTNDPAFHVPAAFAESEAYYVVGFERAVVKAEGKSHKIEVATKRSIGDVRARRSYTEDTASPFGTPNRALSDTEKLIAGPLPASELALGAAVAPFAAAGRDAAEVAILIGVRKPAGSVLAVRPTQVLTSAFSPKGQNVIEFRQRFTITPPWAPAGDLEYDIIARLPLKPGRYEIRAAVQQEGLAGGSVYATVDVPDFAHAPLSMSGVVLSAASSPPLVPAEGVDDLLPIKPTTKREFRTSENVVAMARVYQGGSSNVPVQVAVKIVDGRGTAVSDESLAVEPGQFGAARMYEQHIALPLGRLTPGEYLMTISASAGSDQVRREVVFRVK